MEIKEYQYDEWLAEGKRRFGDDWLVWKFVCPSCGNVQCAEDFREYKGRFGFDPSIAYFSCIGRFNGNENTTMCSGKIPCNYTTGGLINISPVRVIDGKGVVHSVFDFASPNIEKLEVMMGKNQFKIEYLEEFNKIKHSYEYWIDDRNKLVEKYSWAIPNLEALQTLRRYSPILEIGAGKGYWAYLMRKTETLVQAFDLKSSDEVKGSWSMVFKINDNMFNYTHGHTLFLCWPPYENPMAYDAITKFEGENVIYIGEGCGGCTADNEFHDYLFDNFVQVDAVKIPQWWGIHDGMTVWERLEE